MTYFETVFKKQNHLIELLAPIILQEVAIIKDTVDDQIQLRNIFYNVGNQNIIAIAVKITQFDVFGEQISDPFEFIYEDILSRPSETFGNKIAIDLLQKTRRVQVEVLKAVLQDGTVWVSHPENIVCIQPQHEIEASDEYISSIDDNEILPFFYYVENDSCWQCTCGEPNKISSLSCYRCNRTRDVVKEKFNKSALTLGFSEYQKEREKIELEKERLKQPKIEIKEERKEQSRNRNVFLLILAAVAMAIIIVMVIYSPSLKTQSREKEIINQDTETLISQTSDSIKQYVYMIGKQAPKGEQVNVSQDFLDNLDNVFVMGQTGTVEHEYADGMGDTIVMMHWRSNKEVSEDEYKKFVLLLNDYCGSTGETGYFDDDVQTESIRWLDPIYNLHVISWYEQNIINIRWQLKDDQKTEQGIENENVKHEIEATAASLKPYLALIGTNAEDGSVNVDDEFVDNVDNVYVMGQIGTINHATTDDSGKTITLMEWVSNESIDDVKFVAFVDLLNQFFNDTATLSHYDNVTSEDVWAWHITSDNLWPICYLENNKAIIRWYEKSSVDIPEESEGEISESKNALAKSSHKTDDPDYDTQSLSGSITRQVPQSNSEGSESLNDSTNKDNGIPYDATLRYGSGSVMVFSTKDSMDRFMTAMVKEDQGTIDEMLASGDAGYVSQDTKCNIIEQHISWGKVLILEGSKSGRTVCVVSEAIQKK